MFLDDLRDPPEGEWVVVRSTMDAIALCHDGIPEFISFDHDLGGDDRSVDFIKWMIERDLDQPGFIPENFQYNIHSANPVGVQNIRALLDRYLEFRNEVE
jgi:hypothetical protein